MIYRHRSVAPRIIFAAQLWYISPSLSLSPCSRSAVVRFKPAPWRWPKHLSSATCRPRPLKLTPECLPHPELPRKPSGRNIATSNITNQQLPPPVTHSLSSRFGKSDKPGGPPVHSLFSSTASPAAPCDNTPQPSVSQASFSTTTGADYSGVYEDSSDVGTWVTVFGFPPSAASYVLTQAAMWGHVLEHRTPAQGNWMHLKFASRLQARKALARSGRLLTDTLIIGVVPCSDPVRQDYSIDLTSDQTLQLDCLDFLPEYRGRNAQGKRADQQHSVRQRVSVDAAAARCSFWRSQYVGRSECIVRFGHQHDAFVHGPQYSATSDAGFQRRPIRLRGGPTESHAPTEHQLGIQGNGIRLRMVKWETFADCAMACVHYSITLLHRNTNDLTYFLIFFVMIISSFLCFNVLLWIIKLGLKWLID